MRVILLSDDESYTYLFNIITRFWLKSDVFSYSWELLG